MRHEQKLPLYQRAAAPNPGDGNTGLSFDKFFDAWRGDDGSWSLGASRDKQEDSTPPPKLEWLRRFADGGRTGESSLLLEHVERVIALVISRHGRIWVFRTTTRFVTGLGRSHPTDNGFAWHHTLGVPYLPASSVKGMIGAGDRGLVLGSAGHVGNVAMLDALPVEPVSLEVDVVTPHYPPGKWPPADWLSPVPVPFLTVAAGARFVFAAVPGVCARASDATADDLQRIEDWLVAALRDDGAGAKTNVGYGRMDLDCSEGDRLLAQWSAKAARVAEEKRLARAAAQMDPLDRELNEIAALVTDPNMLHWVAWLKELESGRWPERARAAAVAARIRSAMEQSGAWRPYTKAKRPEKDRYHQRTQAVMRHLPDPS